MPVWSHTMSASYLWSFLQVAELFVTWLRCPLGRMVGLYFLFKFKGPLPSSCKYLCSMLQWLFLVGKSDLFSLSPILMLRYVLDDLSEWMWPILLSVPLGDSDEVSPCQYHLLIPWVSGMSQSEPWPYFGPLILYFISKESSGHYHICIKIKQKTLYLKTLIQASKAIFWFRLILCTHTSH